MAEEDRPLYEVRRRRKPKKRRQPPPSRPTPSPLPPESLDEPSWKHPWEAAPVPPKPSTGVLRWRALHPDLYPSPVTEAPATLEAYAYGTRATSRSDKGESYREAHRRYERTERGREVTAKAQRKYRGTEKGKLAIQKSQGKYNLSEKGKRAHAEGQRKYYQSEKGKAARRRRYERDKELLRRGKKLGLI